MLDKANIASLAISHLGLCDEYFPRSIIQIILILSVVETVNLSFLSS